MVCKVPPFGLAPVDLDHVTGIAAIHELVGERSGAAMGLLCDDLVASQVNLDLFDNTALAPADLAPFGLIRIQVAWLLRCNS